MEDLEQKMKEKLLEGLIEHMQNKMGDGLASKFPKKPMEVSVAAADPDKLKEGLGKAQDLIGSDDQDEKSDEDRLMDLLGDEEDDDEKAV